MKTKAIKLADISIDGGTQQREKIDAAIVEEYAEAMRCGSKFPPVTLFHDGAQYWLADGFHRFHASRSAEMPDILADVHDGTCRDAVLFSAGANGAHGIRLTNADKRKAVMILLADKEWSVWADAAIARHCKVTHPFVGKLRGEMAPKSPVLPVTVTGDALKPAPVLGVENQNLGAKASKQSAEEPENFGPSDEEIRNAEKEAADEIESLRRVCDSDDAIKAALDEAKRFRELARVFESRNNGLIGELAATKRRISSLERQVVKLEKKIKEQGLVEF